MMPSKKLIPRKHYLEEARLFRDSDVIKVVTGVRRCGKSSLLELIRHEIESDCNPEDSFVSLNLESKSVQIDSENDLYNYCRDHISQNGKTYIFIDEPQRLDGWQHAINAMRVDFDCDIYLTGSNAYLLSSELSTYLSGRYVEIKMLPLVVEEYIKFCGLEFKEDSSVALTKDGSPVLFDDLLERYMLFGGMPNLASLATTQQEHAQYMTTIYETVATKDILHRPRPFGQSSIANPDLLKRLVDFLADNIGRLTSPSKIADYLTSSGEKTTNKTISSYLSSLNDAFLFYKSPRFDLKGKEVLKTNAKQYIVDTGLRSFLEGYRRKDTGSVFENIVFLQLLYEGFTVHVGKLYEKEIDFVAVRDDLKVYIQVADELMNRETLIREVSPLKAIQDWYPKVVIARKGTYDNFVDGIRVIGAKEFFLNSKILESYSSTSSS